MNKYKSFSTRIADVIEDELVTYGAERDLANTFVKKFWQANERDFKVLFKAGREFSKYLKF